MRSSLLALLLVVAASALSCGSPPVTPSEGTIHAVPPGREAIAAMLDDWHDSAARADEARYFGHLDDDAVFLGTDAKERWDPGAFRAYAHPHFARGKAWSFKAIRREITIDVGGRIAWFDEDLDAPNLGPSRGSGVVSLRGSVWKIRQYNLAITVPNERFDAVKQAAAGIAKAPAP